MLDLFSLYFSKCLVFGCDFRCLFHGQSPEAFGISFLFFFQNCRRQQGAPNYNQIEWGVGLSKIQLIAELIKSTARQRSTPPVEQNSQSLRVAGIGRKQHKVKIPGSILVFWPSSLHVPRHIHSQDTKILLPLPLPLGQILWLLLLLLFTFSI